MQNPKQKLRKLISTVLTRYFVWKIYHLRFIYRRFLLKFCTRLLLTNVYKRVFGIVFILFRTLVICQNKKMTWFLHTHRNQFINKSRSRQKKKIPNTFWQTLVRRKPVQNFSKNIKLYVSWSLSRFSIFQENNLFSRK